MKILTLDIESTPNTVHRWQLYGNDTTGITQIVEPSRLLCFAWKWHGSDVVHFGRGSDHRVNLAAVPDIFGLHSQISEADVVITYNGKKFDMPKLNTAFLEAGLAPPSPYQHVDLYQVVRKNFSWPKMGLDYIAQQLLGVGKEPHEGHMLWVKCMRGDPEAWATMEKYNKQDVIITEQLYDKLLPWIPNPPNTLLYDGGDTARKACVRCGSESLQKRGFKVASTRLYQQYQCQSCGGWFRDTRSSEGTTVTG